MTKFMSVSCIHPSHHHSIQIYFGPSIYPSIDLSIFSQPSICSIHPSTQPSIYLYYILPSIHTSIHQSIHSSIHTPSIHPTIIYTDVISYKAVLKSFKCYSYILISGENKLSFQTFKMIQIIIRLESCYQKIISLY